MNVSDYETRMQSLGVSRGQLAEGFKAGVLGTLGFESERDLINPASSMRLRPVTPPEDLSHLSGRRGRTMTDEERARIALRKCGERTRPIYEELAKRAMTASRLAKLSGIEHVVIVHALAGDQVSPTTFTKVWPLLTEGEKALLNWPEIMRRRRKISETNKHPART